MVKRKCAIWNLSKDEIQEKVNKCNSISDMLDAFGYSRSSGSMAKIMKEVIKEYNIDISHFKPFYRTHQKPIYELKDILIHNSPYRNISRLKERLLKENLLEYKCAICGNKGDFCVLIVIHKQIRFLGKTQNTEKDSLKYVFSPTLGS